MRFCPRYCKAATWGACSRALSRAGAGHAPTAFLVTQLMLHLIAGSTSVAVILLAATVLLFFRAFAGWCGWGPTWEDEIEAENNSKITSCLLSVSLTGLVFSIRICPGVLPQMSSSLSPSFFSEVSNIPYAIAELTVWSPSSCGHNVTMCMRTPQRQSREQCGICELDWLR